MTHKYELDRRYPFEATADSVCPPEICGAVVEVWVNGGGYLREVGVTDEFCWNFIGDVHSITHFMVTKYPPEKHMGWVNVYDHCSFTFHASKEAADSHARKSKHLRTACAPFEWKAGQGI